MGLCLSFDCGDCDGCVNPCCLALSACCLVPCLCPNCCGRQDAQQPQVVHVHHPPAVEQPQYYPPPSQVVHVHHPPTVVDHAQYPQPYPDYGYPPQPPPGYNHMQR